MARAGADIPRRSVLKRGLFGGALLALGGGGYLALRSGREVPLPKDGLLALSAREYATVHALAERIVAPRSGTPTVDQVNVGSNVDHILARADEGVRAELRQLLGLFENGLANFVFGGRPRPFTRMSPEEQDRVLAEWRDSAIVIRRTGYQALRTVMMAAYYASPMIWAACAYGGPPQGFHDPDAPVWRGGGAPRPDGNGVFHEGEE